MNNVRLVYKDWKETGISSADAFEKISGKRFSEETARKYMNAVKAILESPAESRLDKVKIESKIKQTTNKNGEKIYTHTSNMLVKINEIENKTPAEMMILHGYDPIKWEMISVTNKAWNGASKLQGTYTLYSSSIQVKPIQDKLSTDIIKEVFNSLKPPKIKPVKYKHSGDLLLELPIMDLHLGKLAWDKESGSDYDIDIATDLYKRTIIDIVSRLHLKYRIARILFPIGQDFFNADDTEGNTFKGTHQDMDSRWQKIYSRGCNLIIWAIEILRKIAPVDIAYVPGNHDYSTAYYLTQNTNSWYRKCKNVLVDISPTPRKYYRFGKCMIGYSHGEETKKQLDKLMQAEAPEIWGKTLFRELHLGHLHNESVKEIPGLKIRRVSSITAPCAWHTNSGYVKVIRQAQAFIWNKNKGLQNIINSVIIN
jgi:hypothetical protein